MGTILKNVTAENGIIHHHVAQDAGADHTKIYMLRSMRQAIMIATDAILFLPIALHPPNAGTSVEIRTSQLTP